MMISAIPALADSWSRGTPPNHATVDVHLTYPNGSNAEGMQVFLSYYEDFGPSALFSSPMGGGHYTFIVDSYNWGPMQLYAHDDNNTLWWFQKQYIEPKGRYLIEGVIAPHQPPVNRIYGTITNGTSGSPIYNATIETWFTDEHMFQASARTTSQTHGSYELFVPNSSYPIYIGIEAFGYQSAYRSFYLSGEKRMYNLDISLYPILVGTTVPIRVRMMDATTGQLISPYGFNIDGISSLFGHYRTSKFTLDYDPSTSYSLLDTEPGEYEFLVRGHDEMNRTYLESSGFINVDDEAITLDIEVPVPDLRKVDTTVTDLDGPIYDVQVYYNTTIMGHPWPCELFGGWRTDGAGKAWLMIPTDTGIELNFFHQAYVQRTMMIYPGSETVSLNITLEKKEKRPDPDPSYGNVSVLVLDQTTDVPMPSAWLGGYGQIPGEDRMAYFNGHTGPDGYLNCSAEVATYPSITVSCSLGTGEIVNLTVSEGSLTTRTVYLNRADYPPDPVEISFLIRDLDGIPIPDQWLILSIDESHHSALSSDGLGMVRSYLKPGRYSLSTWDNLYPPSMVKRMQWVMPEIEITIDEDGGMLPDVILYPSGPLFYVDGMVKDARTGDPILEQGVDMLSKHYLDTPPTRQIPYIMPYFSGDEEEDRPAVDLFHESGGSDHTGYYRLWGRESATISVLREGYYPYREEIEITGSLPEHDILLVPVPERNASVTGMLIDADGNPLNGSVAIVDPAMDDYEIDSQMINDSGEFSLLTYPGDFRVVFGNASLWDYIDIEIPPEGISNLRLVLAPRTFINGTVMDWEGDPVAGIDLTLSGGWSLSVFDNVTTTTNSSGGFSFSAVRGIYRIDFNGSDMYEPLNISLIECSGWDPLTIDMVLEDLTEGYLSGRVIGSGGPFDGKGIPYCFVYIWDEEWGITSGDNWTDTDGQGYFTFNRTFPIGVVMDIITEPPDNISGKRRVRAGYLAELIENATISRYGNYLVVTLVYQQVPNATWANITGFGPTGENVPLDAQISINFTHEMDFGNSMIGSDIVSDPPINFTRGGYWMGTEVFFDHLNFEPNTVYTITISGDILSVEGYPLWNRTGITWTFKTGSTFWHIDRFIVNVINGNSVQADAWGGENLSVFIIINEVGSYKLDEIEPGHYRLFIGEEWFSWDSYYTYYFSDKENGKDDDPDLRGDFKTYTGGKPPQYYEEEQYQDEPDLVGCLACCGIVIVVVLVIVGLVLLLSKIKSRYDEKKEE
jgi:hypothetical protein